MAVWVMCLTVFCISVTSIVWKELPLHVMLDIFHSIVLSQSNLLNLMSRSVSASSRCSIVEIDSAMLKLRELVCEGSEGV